MTRLAKASSALTHGRRGPAALALAMACALVLVAAPSASATKYVDSFFGNPTSSTGSTAGLFNQPRGLAINLNGAGGAGAGDVYVVDGGNHRIQQFTADGAFIRSWGRDVVSAGPGQADEQQTVRVNATAGTYTLTFSAQTTTPIAYDATAATVQTALEELSNLAPGDVIVSGGPGGAGGANPYVVQFAGTQANLNVAQMTGSAAGLTGTVVVATGIEGATGFEICSIAAGDTCKAGVTSGGVGGDLNAPRGVAVNQSNGHVYVTEGARFRVQEYTATGEFVRAFGQDAVIAGGIGEQTVLLNEQQSVTLGHFGGTLTGGTFKLTFNAQSTPDLPYNASAAQIDAALEALGTIGAGNVSVSGAGPWTVEFTGTLAQVNVAQMSGDGSKLTGTGLIGEASVTTTIPGGSNPGIEVCNLASQCKTGISGSIGGAFGSTFDGYPAVVPVGAPNAGNVLVADPGNRRVQEFTATGQFVRAMGRNVVSAGPGNSAEGGFEVCVAANGDSCVAGPANDGFSAGVPVGQFINGSPKRVTADATGAIYTVEFVGAGLQRVQKFVSQSGSPGLSPSVFMDLPFLGNNTATEVAVNPQNGNVLVSVSTSSSDVPEGEVECEEPQSSEARLREYSPAGTQIDTHLACAGIRVVGSTPNFEGIAINPTNGRIYGATQHTGFGHRVYVLDNDGIQPLAQASVSSPTAVTASSAQLTGTVNPNSVGNTFTTKWRLQISRNGVSWKNVGQGELAAGTSALAVSATATELLPNTLYRVRIVTNKQFANPDVNSAELTFLTDAVPPTVSGTGVDSIGQDSARIKGFVNPHSTTTSYRFEYGVGGFDSAIPIPDAPVGAGPNSIFVSQLLSGLAPHTTYQFRLVATSSTEGTTTGVTRTFTTSPTAPSAGVARGYELVSPADKPTGPGVGFHSANSVNDGINGIYSQLASADGEQFLSQIVYGGLLSGDAAFASIAEQVIGTRTASGWVSRPLMNRIDYSDQPIAGATVDNATDDFSMFAVGYSTNTASSKFFPEVTTQGNGYLRDPAGHWRYISGSVEQNAGDLNREPLAADGDVLGIDTIFKGLLGPEDPTNDSAPGVRNAALVDVSEGISDTWEDRGITDVVGICHGEGADRTELPTVSGGKVSAQACPPPAPGRSESLISAQGSSFSANAAISLKNVISADGSRAFFMSPAEKGQLYVREESPDGSLRTRWLSRPEISEQASALLGNAKFQGASRNGDKVFFQTNSPLTPDDPNGTGAPAPVGGIKTGTASENSWDLYEYALPSGSDGKPNDSDPDGGTLTRISAGPLGTGDCNSPMNGSQARISTLRFASEDGSRVYFTCAAPLPGVPAPQDGTVTSPEGTTAATATVNLYLYDSTEPPAERWRFVALLPRDGGDGVGISAIRACATTLGNAGEVLNPSGGIGTGSGISGSQTSCIRATPDGGLFTFWTDGRLTTDDPDTTSVDVYAYDADEDELTRITAPQGGVGDSYTCEVDGNIQCYGDRGFYSPDTYHRNRGVAIDPETGEHIAYFQSKSRLIPEDTDTKYDVYEWKAGKLSLVTKGITDRHAVYTGNDVSGEDVFFITDKRLTWEDIDEVRDVYDARIGGGFPQPLSPITCNILADACQGSPTSSPSSVPPAPSQSGSSGNVGSVGKPKGNTKKTKKRCAKGKVRRKGQCTVNKRATKRSVKRGANESGRAGR